MENKYNIKRKLMLLLYIIYSLSVYELTAQNINSLEYWFDNDYMNKITLTQSNPIILTANIKGLSYGLHDVHYRVKDNFGYYSSITSNQFFYQPLYTADATFTYWFDDNTKNSKSILLSNVNNIEVQADGTTLPFGSHYLNYSINKNNQPISTINRSQFINYASEKASSVNPILIRYWIDNFVSLYSEVNIYSSNLNDNQITQSIQNNLTEGLHSLYFQIKDNTGNWSAISTSSFSYTKNKTDINNLSTSPLIISYNSRTKKLIITSIDVLNEVRLISLDGKIINIKQLNNTKLDLDLSPYANGVYLIEIVNNNNKSMTKKFIKD